MPAPSLVMATREAVAGLMRPLKAVDVSSRPIVMTLSAAEPLVRSPAPASDPIVNACHTLSVPPLAIVTALRIGRAEAPLSTSVPAFTVVVPA